METVELSIAERVAHVRLQRPDSRNAINAEMAQALLSVALECSRREDVRSVLLSATGNSFCVGGDIKVFAVAGAGLSAAIREIVVPLHAAMAVFSRMAAPVVATVQGIAAGGGLGLALTADLTLAARSAKFKAAYTAIGLSGDVGVTYTLPRMIGLRRARQLFLTNRSLSASEAQEWGMVDEVFDDDQLQEEGLALARRLAEGPRLAFEACKNLLHDSFGSSLEEQMAQEARWMCRLATTSDVKDALQAFLEKRSPAFEGR